MRSPSYPYCLVALLTLGFVLTTSLLQPTTAQAQDAAPAQPAAQPAESVVVIAAGDIAKCNLEWDTYTGALLDNLVDAFLDFFAQNRTVVRLCHRASLESPELHREIHSMFTELEALGRSILRRLVPELRDEDLVPAPAGVRAQAVARDGRLVDDFLVERGARTVHLLNAPSPAATASLEIAAHAVELLRED